MAKRLSSKKKKEIIAALKKAHRKYKGKSPFHKLVRKSIERAIKDLDEYIKYWDGRARIEYLTGIKCTTNRSRK